MVPNVDPSTARHAIIRVLRHVGFSDILALMMALENGTFNGVSTETDFFGILSKSHGLTAQTLKEKSECPVQNGVHPIDAFCLCIKDGPLYMSPRALLVFSCCVQVLDQRMKNLPYTREDGIKVIHPLHNEVFALL